MKLNRNSILVKLVESTYLECPYTSCIFFWASFIAIVILPLSFVGHLINYILKDYVFPSLIFVLVWPLCIVCGFSILFTALGLKAVSDMSGWQVLFISATLGWSLVGITSLFLYLLATFADSIYLYGSKLCKIANKIHCKPIEWDD